MKETVGFIGLGTMGRPMARNLLIAGYPVVAHNRSRGPVEELSAGGADAANTPAEVAERAAVVITMLPDTSDVEEVVFGASGVMESLRPGSLIVDMSTIRPAIARRIAREAREHGADALDAPVSGGELGAREASLSVMVGGSEDSFGRARPILRSMGRNVTWIGEPGAGQVAKAANQVIVGVTIQAVAEGLLLAARSGVDPARVREALLGGFAQSRILEVHGQRMLDRDFDPGFRSRLHRKDLAIAVDAGREAGVALPSAALVGEALSALVGSGGGDQDHSALLRVLEAMSGREGL
jgi:2-hydroxy-3-oxopropionate reductase